MSNVSLAASEALHALRVLSRHNVAVSWVDGKVEFRCSSPPTSHVIALLDAHEPAIVTLMRPNGDGRSLLDLARERHKPLLEAVDAARPPDASDTQWRPAIEGLRFFLLSGHGDEALRLGWSSDELFSVPSHWPNVSQTGAGLLIGDCKIISITPAEIRIKASGDATQAFYRKPEGDYGLVFRDRLKLIVGHYPGGSDEPRLRAIDHTINVCRANTGLGLEQAKQIVLQAIANGPAR